MTITNISPVTVENARRAMGYPGDTSVTPGPAQHIRYRNMLHAMMRADGITEFTPRTVCRYLGTSAAAMNRMAGDTRGTRNGDTPPRCIPVMTDPNRSRTGNGARPDGWARGRNACAIAYAYVLEMRADIARARADAANIAA